MRRGIPEGGDTMKLYVRLHATAQLHADAGADSVNDTLSHSIGMQFLGTGTDDGWTLYRADHNLFRPVIRVRLLPEEDGTLVTAAFLPDRTLMLFMAAWSLLVIGIAVWRNWLLLILLPLFWACVFIGFARGVRDGKQELMRLLDAYEILD